MHSYLWSKDAMKEPWNTPEDFLSKLINVISNWRHILTLFFESYKHELLYTGIKAELHYAALLSGGWVLFGVPAFIPAFLPVYAYKLLANDPQVWGTLCHYNMEFAVLIPLAVIWFASLQSSWYQVRILIVAAILVHFINGALLDYRKSVW